MITILKLSLHLLSLLSVAHVNAPKSKADSKAIAGYIEEITFKPPRRISRLIGKTTEFSVLVEGDDDAVSDENLLKNAKTEFDKVAAENMVHFIGKDERAQWRNKHKKIDIDGVIQDMINIAWTNYGAIRTIYEYQTRKASKKHVGSWRVPAETKDSHLLNKFYSRYMHGGHQLVKLLVEKSTPPTTVKKLIEHLGTSISVPLTKPNGQALTMKEKAKTFYELADKALGQLTTPPHMLDSSRITLDDDEFHENFMGDLLENAWTEYAVEHAGN